MNNITPFNFDQLSEEELKLQASLQNERKTTEEVDFKSPEAMTIRAILDYSKALSIRKSKEFGSIENLLN
jgi:hypothetical protein